MIPHLRIVLHTHAELFVFFLGYRAILLGWARCYLQPRRAELVTSMYSHTDREEKTSTNRTVGSYVAFCFYVFGLYHSFMMKKTIYRACLSVRGPTWNCRPFLPPSPRLATPGLGRGEAARSVAAPNARVPLAIILSCFDFTLFDIWRMDEVGGVRPRCAIDLSFEGAMRYVMHGRSIFDGPHFLIIKYHRGFCT